MIKTKTHISFTLLVLLIVSTLFPHSINSSKQSPSPSDKGGMGQKNEQDKNNVRRICPPRLFRLIRQAHQPKLDDRLPPIKMGIFGFYCYNIMSSPRAFVVLVAFPLIIASHPNFSLNFRDNIHTNSYACIANTYHIQYESGLAESISEFYIGHIEYAVNFTK